MPPRKTSRPPPYAARNNSSMRLPPAIRSLLRRHSPRTLVTAVVGLLTVFWLLGRIAGGGGSGGSALIPAVAIGSGPPVVIVTVLDPKADAQWTSQIKKNREDYAKRHGYLTFFPGPSDYPLNNSPPSWAKIPAVRHAMTLNPGSTFFWYLEATHLIANPSLPIHTHVASAKKLEELMIVNEPVVPPDSVIKTFANLKGDRIDIVVTQDKEGLSPASFIIRNGEWAKYFLDSWFDPIYRSYNFQKAETHALEHIVQWHGTILAKLALVPQNTLNAYVTGPANKKNGQYREGDLVAAFPGCDKKKDSSCAQEMAPYLEASEKATSPQ